MVPALFYCLCVYAWRRQMKWWSIDVLTHCYIVRWYITFSHRTRKGFSKIQIFWENMLVIERKTLCAAHIVPFPVFGCQSKVFLFFSFMRSKSPAAQKVHDIHSRVWHPCETRAHHCWIIKDILESYAAHMFIMFLVFLDIFLVSLELILDYYANSIL